jgi:hypothetical protein
VSAEPDFGKDEEEHEADRQTSSMRDQLSKEVASWSKERRQQTGETIIEPTRPANQRRSPRPAAEAKKPSVPPLAGNAGSGRSKPFSMSYDGMTQAEYTRYLLERGTR